MLLFILTQWCLALFKVLALSYEELVQLTLCAVHILGHITLTFFPHEKKLIKFLLEYLSLYYG